MIVHRTIQHRTVLIIFPLIIIIIIIIIIYEFLVRHCLDVSVGQVRRCVWETFADSVM